MVEGHLPEDWPAGRFDLVVLTEVLYYLDRPKVDETIGRAVGSLEPGGHLVAVHWRQVADDFRTPGAEVHDALRQRAGLEPVAGYEDADFLLDVLERR